MAATYAIQVPGPVLVRVGSEAGGDLADLGYTDNGAQLSFNGYFEDVHSDDMGGDAGPPADVLYHGETALIRVEVTKWDPAVVAVLNGRLRGLTTPGTPAGPGVLMFASGADFRVLLLSTKDPYNFPRTIIRNPIQLPRRGSHAQIVVLEFEAHKDANGILYNSTSA